jgi:hypothetical protein
VQPLSDVTNAPHRSQSSTRAATAKSAHSVRSRAVDASRTAAPLSRAAQMAAEEAAIVEHAPAAAEYDAASYDDDFEEDESEEEEDEEEEEEEEEDDVVAELPVATTGAAAHPPTIVRFEPQQQQQQTQVHSPVPEMATALEHIVGQLDIVARTMGLFERRLAMHERKVRGIEDSICSDEDEEE